MAVRLVMLGAPGAGKGTQAERFARTRAVPKISTGNILREAVVADTELGRQSKALMESGQLVPDELITGIVSERLARGDADGGFVLDGFPRTLPQAAILDELLERRAIHLAVVPRPDAAAAGAQAPRTPRERFDQEFTLLTPGQ